MRYETRLRRLEARRLRPVSHFLSSVRYPWYRDEPDHEWRRGLVCPCGQRGCLELRVGAMVPEKALSPEAWAARARQYQEGRDDA
jgi:hypothetical protein